MSITSELARIAAAKASLKDSIAAKGVSIPAAATIDEYAGYVDDIAISSGAALPETITAGDTVVLTSSVMMAKALGSGGDVVPTNMSITIPKAGTYRFKFATYNGRVAANYTRAQLRKNGSAVGSECGSNAAANAAYEYSLDLECAANDVIYLHAYNATNTLSAAGAVGALRACINWDNGF